MAPIRGGTGRRGRPRKLDAMPKKSTSKQHRRSEAASSGRGRRPKDPGSERKTQATEEVDEISIAQPNTSQYVQLAPKARRIPQHVIDTWPTVTPPILEQIGLILKRAKDATSLEQRDAQKREDAEGVLDSIVRQLERHCTKMKMPTLAKAQDFNLDQLTEKHEHAYQQVTAARHRKQLLEESVGHALASLEEHEKIREGGKKNAQEWKARWKTLGKGQLHPLLQSSDHDAITGDRPEDIGLQKQVLSDMSLLDAPASELAPLLEQLRRSLEAMQNNHIQTEGIHDAVRGAHVALDDVLFKHSSTQQYGAL